MPWDEPETNGNPLEVDAPDPCVCGDFEPTPNYWDICRNCDGLGVEPSYGPEPETDERSE